MIVVTSMKTEKDGDTPTYTYVPTDGSRKSLKIFVKGGTER